MNPFGVSWRDVFPEESIFNTGWCMRFSRRRKLFMFFACGHTMSKYVPTRRSRKKHLDGMTLRRQISSYE
jgi:hypothetical protein